MITHDVDEALLLADKILLMTNGPKAWVAEIVENTLPKHRSRAELHKQPNYYPLRNHLIEFLVTRSRDLALHPEARPADRNPPVIRPMASPPHDNDGRSSSIRPGKRRLSTSRAAAFPRRKLLGEIGARRLSRCCAPPARRPTNRFVFTQRQPREQAPCDAKS